MGVLARSRTGRTYLCACGRTGNTTSSDEPTGGVDRTSGGAAMVGGACGRWTGYRVHGLDVCDQLYIGVGTSMAAKGVDAG